MAVGLLGIEWKLGGWATRYMVDWWEGMLLGIQWEVDGWADMFRVGDRGMDC